MPVFNSLQGPQLPPLTPKELKQAIRSSPIKEEEEIPQCDEPIQGQGWTLDDYDYYMS